MNIFKKAYCRFYQSVFRVLSSGFPYRDPELFESVDEIVPLLQKLNKKTVLLVTGPVLRSSGITAHLEQLLKENNIHCAVYDKTGADPTIHQVEEALEIYKKENCECLIAFGGGSPMDCAKAVGARVAYPEKSLVELKGSKVSREIPTLIAIPTTAGTGSEVTLTSVITDSENKHKYIMNNFTMIPSYAVLDPKLTYTLPPSLTATIGMDALTHAVEAYIGCSTTEETRALALEAVKMIFENIEIAYKDGTNHEARSNMLHAAYKAGKAFSKSYVGYIHAVAHSLGGQYDIAHGLANSVLMPIVLEEYGETAHNKLLELAISAGVATAEDSPAEGAEKFIQAIRKLNQNMNIPETLPGIKKEDIPHMAKYADQEANPAYPVPKLMDAKELEQFYVKVADWN